MATAMNGQVIGLAKYTANAPNTIASFCREVIGGSYEIAFNNIRQVGATGQLVVRKGTTDVTISATVIALGSADLALFFPTSAGTQVTFPDTNDGLLVEADDGTAGKEFLIDSMQPRSITVSCGAEPDAMVQFDCSMAGVIDTMQAVGTDDVTYSSELGHTINDCTVQLAAADADVLSWSLSNDLGTEIFNPQNTKSSGDQTHPDGYVITTQDPRCEIVTADPLKFENSDIIGDTWTAEDITIALANGTAGEDITITCDSFVPDTLNMPFESESLTGFAHTFMPDSGNLYNRVTIA